MAPFKPKRRNGLNRRRAPYKKTVAKAVKSVRRSNFKKAVQSVMKEQVENKQAYHTNASSSLVKFNSGIDAISDMNQILPAINKGPQDNERIGERIRAQRFQVSGFMKFDYNSSAASPSSSVGVRMMVLSLKTRSSLDSATASAAPLQALLKKGGTSTAFTGILSDLTAPINTDLFTCHYNKVTYLKQDMVFQSGTPTNSWVTSDVSRLIRFFKINLKVKNKDLKYEDSTNSGLYPTNYYPFLVIGYSYLDGTTPDVLNQKLGLEYTTTLTYEDA